MNKTCVEQLQGGTATKSWNTVPCSVRRQFFCQKPEGQCVCSHFNVIYFNKKRQSLNIWMKINGNLLVYFLRITHTMKYAINMNGR